MIYMTVIKARHDILTILFSRYIFFVESIQNILNDKRKFASRISRENDHPDCLKATDNFPLKTLQGTGRFKVVDDILNQDGGLKMIDECLVPQLCFLFPDNDCIFMHTGAPCHKAKIVSSQLRNMNI